MISHDDAAQLRERLLQLLAEDSHNTERLLRRLDALSAESGIETHAALLLILTQLAFDETEARTHWEGILEHRHALSLALGRDAGLRVALLDYFVNVNRRLSNPSLIDIAMEDATPHAPGDPLTGLADGRALRGALQGEIRRARRYGHRTAVALFDVDGFAAVNARVGALVGDRLLREAAILLGNKIRDIDLAARPGEDELALVLPQTERNGAFLVAERFRRELQSHFARRDAAGGPVGLTVSGGVAAYPDDGTDAETLLERAAQALYLAKAAGKNTVRVHQPERRRFLRFDLRSRRCEVEVLGVRQASAGSVRNLSHSGLLFGSPEPLEVGEDVEIRLEGGGGAEPRRTLRLRGQVVRLEALGTGEGDRYEVGVAFDADTGRGEEDLLVFLETAGPSSAEPT